MSDPFNISTSGLLAFQRALATTSHNITNANTEGYTRQRVELSARPPQGSGGGYTGQGVYVSNIDRIEDRFLNLQVRFNISEASRLEEFSKLAGGIDNLLSEGEASLAPALQSFFGGIEEVTDNPASSSARTLLLSNAENLVGRFQSIDMQLTAKNETLNVKLTDLVSEVNALADNIAKINSAIIIEKGRYPTKQPNDLLDQRETLINQLSERIGVSVVEDKSGAANVFIGKGQVLVLGAEPQTLAVVKDPENFMNLQIAYQNNGSYMIVSSQLTGGSIGGILDFRQTILNTAQNEIGRIATVLTSTFNEQHRNGMDLNGSLGGDFFTTSSPVVVNNANNIGTATVTSTIIDVTALKASDYRLYHNGTNFTLTRISDNVSVTGAGPFNVDGMNITVTAGASSGDSYLIRPVYSAPGTVNLATKDINALAAAAPIRTSSLVSNIGDATINQGQVLDVTDANLLDTVEIIFNNPPTTFNINNITDGVPISAGVAYSNGGNITFNGVQISINGLPNAGDRFRVERNTSSAADNRNALLLSNLKSQNLIGGTATYTESYASMVARSGTMTNQVKINGAAQKKLLSEAQIAREAVSGVNLDEEAANLLRFQRSYQAAAQVITAADTVFQSLLAAIRR